MPEAEEEEKRDPVEVVVIDDDDGANDHQDDGEGDDVVGETEDDADVVDALQQGFLPNCDHRFHFDCIVAWAKVTNLCPLCKTKFNTITRHDVNGNVVHTKPISDHKQVFKPNPADHDIAAQLSLVNQARCELCGLRLVSRVKTFFGRLHKKEKEVAIELGCLSVLHQWIRSPEQQENAASASSPNPQVLDAVLAILETLPVRKEHLVEENGLQDTMDSIPELPDASIEMRERAIELSERWRKLNPPAPSEPPRMQVDEQTSSPVNTTQNLPVITAFTSPKRPTRSKGKRKRKNEPWSETVVEYVKGKLYPLYKQSHSLTRERFKTIVKQVADLFSQEAASMQSALLLPSGELSNLAKMRIKKLINQVYKTGLFCSATS
ncbi:hypothetical protein BBP00_00004439 [Phytophthora kernoviae]|uniref:RING-type domain-containing protein n=1 Tax=Phytophthora kernoviae TaxID=325452 RepID=A0A3F2RT88_9STRA|nr:hypothetical protein BBP00_00004439 [Phytophthora kernoviae]